MLPKSQRVKSSKEFTRIFHSRKVLRSKNFRLHFDFPRDADNFSRDQAPPETKPRADLMSPETNLMPPKTNLISPETNPETNPKTTTKTQPNKKTPQSKFAVVTSKKLGKAHLRNKIRRQIFSILKTHPIRKNSNIKLVVFCQPSVSTLIFNEIETELVELLDRIRY